MTIVKPTLKRVALIWFAITFRALVFGVGAAVLASVLISLFVFATGGGEDAVRAIARVAGPAIGLPASLYAAYSQLGRKCGDVRLVLVAAD
ncbi:MAG: hypothetical protein AAB227_11290 [Pseudomonadota bacterium]|mgnify:CR=1 FL=1